ncbi:hypothetical protein QBC43DRAFT_283177 [Cladorrhinum sp. PSN259]|nr:hypothetical protein QBC43DRAFT_283177 [Cladorrhinum sp. PSN259]
MLPKIRSIIAFLCLFTTALAQVAGRDTPITLDGALDDCQANDDSFNTGGFIQLNGWNVTVPKNMLVTFPAAFVPWKEFVANKSAVLGYEVTLTGNVVNGVPLAGQIFVQQFAFEFNQGYIEQVNLDGTLKIKDGPIVRLNDPNAVFSSGYSTPFMVVDDVSPSVSAFNGFPMCIPRNTSDPLCPMSNRPTVTGQPTNYLRSFQAPNPLVMAPFVPGDFIDYRGYKNAAGEIVAFEVVVGNLAITTTSPAPTYMRVELALIGIYNNDPTAEIHETRFVAFSTDFSAVISVAALDLDPCTGEHTERAIGTMQPRIDGANRNKYQLRFDGTQSVPYAREYIFKASTGVQTTQNGLKAGEFIAPVLEWVQPELINIGQPPIVNDFSTMWHLTKGVGPDEDGNIWGPLEPFPQSLVPTFNISSCAPIVPEEPEEPVEGEGAVATPRIQATIPVNAAGTVSATVALPKKLYARNLDTFKLWGFQDNTNPVFANDNLTYTWSVDTANSAGTQANLQTFTPAADGKSISIRFANAAPVGEYTFRLNITSASQNTTGTSTFAVEYFTGPDTVQVTAVTWTSSQSGTLTASCSSNYLVDFRVNMQITHPGDGAASTAGMTATPAGSGNWNFQGRKIDQPGVISCQTSLGGFATRSGTTTKRDLDGATSRRGYERSKREMMRARRSFAGRL